jgi:hypothetical protein
MTGKLPLLKVLFVRISSKPLDLFVSLLSFLGLSYISLVNVGYLHIPVPITMPKFFILLCISEDPFHNLSCLILFPAKFFILSRLILLAKSFLPFFDYSNIHFSLISKSLFFLKLFYDSSIVFSSILFFLII